MTQISDGRQVVRDLVERFAANRASYLRPSSDFNETQLRTDFLDRLLGALGWDVHNGAGVPQRLREVVVEELISVEDEAAKKKPDYTLRRGGERLLFVEAKKPRVPIASAREPAFQTRRYGWNAGMSVSVLTNFDKLAIYDCTRRPREGEEANVGRLQLYDHTEYVARFDEIYDRLSRASAHSGRFDELFGTAATKTGSEPFDQYFLQQIEDWRRRLAGALATANPQLDAAQLNFLVQRLINRIVFLRICEDRRQETYERLRGVRNYEQLKAVFRVADRRYNSGLFDFLEDQLSLSVEVDSGVLIDIFDQLYAPRSPYDFSVVEPGVLGEIYEQFLAKQVTFAHDRQIEVIPKPEVVQADGVVSTPKQVADRIVAETLAPLCTGKSPQELDSLRIADIACGSGIFLLSAYEYLLDFHLDWYVQHGPHLSRSAVYQLPVGEWRLTLAEKHRILTHCIYGVDIDVQAVEIARFSLLLKVLEGDSAAYIDAQLEESGIKALPNLDGNLLAGNSLVDSAFYRFDEEALSSEGQMVEINPLDWHDAFPQPMESGGFDAIVGNPPYIRIQNMVRYSPREVAFLKSSASPYRTASQDNFDKYALFIERALGLLRPGGRLGYIVPHKFFTIRSGRGLRDLLSQGRFVSHIVHFGANQVFPGRSTYTCVLILSKGDNPELAVEHVDDVAAWRQGHQGEVSIRGADTLGNSPWVFVLPQLDALFQRIRTAPGMTRLGGRDGIADIFVGVQTSADRVYIIDTVSDLDGNEDGIASFTDGAGQTHEIETAVLRPCLLDVQLAPFGSPEANKSIIFPYKIEGGRAVAYTPDEMRTRFPRCWEYLVANEQALRNRNVTGGAPEAWYRFGRAQSLTKFDGRSKLIWPVLSLEPRYAYDGQDVLFTGGGNGPYYALRSSREDGPSLFYLLAVLSHPVIDLMVRTSGSIFRGGYVSHGKQFLEGLPIYVAYDNPDERPLYDTIVHRTQQLIQSAREMAAAGTPMRREQYRRRCGVLRRQVETAVGTLYGISAEDAALAAELTGAPDGEADSASADRSAR